MAMLPCLQLSRSKRPAINVFIWILASLHTPYGIPFIRVIWSAWWYPHGCERWSHMMILLQTVQLHSGQGYHSLYQDFLPCRQWLAYLCSLARRVLILALLLTATTRKSFLANNTNWSCWWWMNGFTHGGVLVWDVPNRQFIMKPWVLWESKYKYFVKGDIW